MRTSRVVGAEEWGGAAALANWIQSRGGCPGPSSHVGLEIPTGAPTTIFDTRLTTESGGWWREGAFAFALLVTGHREPDVSTLGGVIDLEASDGTTTFGSWRIDLVNVANAALGRVNLLRAFDLQSFDLAARGGEIELVVTAQANIVGLYVDLVQVMELPRSVLALGVADRAVLPASCEANSPVFDVRHLSARGAVDAVLYADARRQCYFRALTREHPIVLDVSSSFPKTELFPFGIPLQAPIGAPGDLTSGEVVVAIEARFDDVGDGANKAFLYVDTDEGGSALTASVLSSSWTTILLRPTVAAEDLDAVDGLPGGVFEMLRISAEVTVNSGSPKLDVGTIEVFQPNAEGELGFTPETYYVQASAAPLIGSDTMTRSVMVRIDGAPATCTLVEHEDAGGGWALRIDGSGQAVFRLRNGAATYDLKGPVMVQGLTYVITASWDGAQQRLVVNQAASAPQAAARAAPANAAVLGASTGGDAPAADCTILGLASSDSVSLSDAAMQAHNALCAAVADMRAFVGCEHLWSARFGLHCDLLGEAPWPAVGATTSSRFAPRIG